METNALQRQVEAISDAGVESACTVDGHLVVDLVPSKNDCASNRVTEVLRHVFLNFANGARCLSQEPSRDGVAGEENVALR
jgi:hypothetical protein